VIPLSLVLQATYVLSRKHHHDRLATTKAKSIIQGMVKRVRAQELDRLTLTSHNYEVFTHWVPVSEVRLAGFSTTTLDGDGHLTRRLLEDPNQSLEH
jgi:hypothetical protein